MGNSAALRAAVILGVAASVYLLTGFLALALLPPPARSTTTTTVVGATRG